MPQTHEQLNRFMVDVFHHVLRAEERLLRQAGYDDLSISEMHVIEAIANAERTGSNNARSIAGALNITPGSLTAAVNVLEKKGYVLRARQESDRRQVSLCLTDKGRTADLDHQGVHRHLVDGILGRLSEEEARVLASALNSVSQFFEIEGASDA